MGSLSGFLGTTEWLKNCHHCPNLQPVCCCQGRDQDMQLSHSGMTPCKCTSLLTQFMQANTLRTERSTRHSFSSKLPPKHPTCATQKKYMAACMHNHSCIPGVYSSRESS